MLFRVLQECLTNVLRHSGSAALDVRVDYEEGRAILSVRDHGRGIHAEKLKGFEKTAEGFGVGLGGMKQRVGELGGQMRIASDGDGACVTVTLPLTASRQDRPISHS